MKIVTVDPRRTATTDIADLHLGIAPGADVALFNRLLAAIVSRGALDRRFVAAHVEACRPPSLPRRRATPRHRRARRRSPPLPRPLGAHREGRDGLQPGREPVDLRHRQGQRDHQLPPRHRPHRQARHGAVQRHRPAQRHGRARGRRPRQHARLPPVASRTRPTAPPSAASGTRRASPTRPGQRRSTCSSAVARGQIKALWVIGTNPARQPARRRCRCARRMAACPLRRRLRLHRRHDRHRAASPHVVLPAAGWGEKDGTVTNSERCISPPARRCCRRRARPGRDWWHRSPKSAAGWAWTTRLRLDHGPPNLPRARARSPPIRTAAPRLVRHSALAGIRTPSYDAAQPVRWAGHRDAGRRAALRATGASSPPRGAPAWCRSPTAPRHARRPPSTPSASTPGASATSGTR